MRMSPIPDRYRTAVMLVAFAPVGMMFVTLLGEVFLDDYFGLHWTQRFNFAVFAGTAVVFGIVFLLFRGPVVTYKNVTENSLAKFFRWCVVIGSAFALDALFESLIYPAFALNGWQPERFVWHAIEMVIFTVAVVWIGHRTRMKFLRKLREAKDSTESK